MSVLIMSGEKRLPEAPETLPGRDEMRRVY